MTVQVQGYEVVFIAPHGELEKVVEELEKKGLGWTAYAGSVARTTSEAWRRHIRDRFPHVAFHSHKSQGAERVNGGYEWQDVYLTLKGE